MVLSIQLPDDVAAALTSKAEAQGLTLEALLQKLAEDTAPPAHARQPGRPHISEIIRSRMSRVDPTTMAAMPKDGASQHDHYIYGLPKREE